MKRIVVVALAAIMTLTGCAKSTGPTPPNSPNAGVIVALDSLAAACLISSTLVSGPVAAFLAGPCRTTATGILSIVEANGTAAQIQAAIAVLQADVAALPASTPYLTYANAALALAQEVLTIYEQVTGQTVTTGLRAASRAAPPKAIMWTAPERAHIDGLKVRLAH